MSLLISLQKLQAGGNLNTDFGIGPWAGLWTYCKHRTFLFYKGDIKRDMIVKSSHYNLICGRYEDTGGEGSEGRGQPSQTHTMLFWDCNDL